MAQKDDCIFCKIADKKIPARVLFEDDSLVAFQDIAPQAPVHIVIISKEHIEKLQLSGQLIANFSLILSAYTKKDEKKYTPIFKDFEEKVNNLNQSDVSEIEKFITWIEEKNK